MSDIQNDSGIVSSAVQGLDSVLFGGYLRTGFYLIQGDPGSGKTTLALQFALDRERAGERCLYFSLTESRRDLERTCKSHGWSLAGLKLVELARSGATPESESQASIFDPADTELIDLTKLVRETVERTEPRHVVFDGLSELRLLAGEPLRYRRTLLALKDFFASRDITVLLLDDRSAAFQQVPAESLVGGNVVLERYLPSYGRARRRLFVTKVRGANFHEGYHDYEIRTKSGVVVHPRLVASEHHEEFASSELSSGIVQLDAMLKGGLTAGSTTVLLGPAGAGKSTVSMQFVISALERGAKAAVYVFDEVMQTMMDRSEKLCGGKRGGIRSFIEQGSLHLQQVDPAELSPGAFAHEVRRAVDEGASIVVIDSLNGYINAMPEERFLPTHLHELFAYLNQKGVLTMVIVSQHGVMAGMVPQADINVSYLADSVLLFRFFEADGEIQQAISVFKKRTGPHERSIRQLVIDSTGVHVGEPLREFRGIMTGVPQYLQGSRESAGREDDG